MDVETKKAVMLVNRSMIEKYENLKDEIISSLGELIDAGYGRFPKALRIKVLEEKKTFTGLKKLDNTVYFENNRTKVLYECETASVDELMKVLETINNNCK